MNPETEGIMPPADIEFWNQKTSQRWEEKLKELIQLGIETINMEDRTNPKFENQEYGTW